MVIIFRIYWSKTWYEYYPKNEDYIKLGNGSKIPLNNKKIYNINE